MSISSVLLSRFVLAHAFNKIELKTGEVVWWRDCIMQLDMKHGDQGYVIVWEDSKGTMPCTHHHTYHYPPDLFEGDVR